MRVKILIGLGIAISTDLGMGIIVAHALAKCFGEKMDILSYAAAMFLALLPDLDVVLERIQKGGVTGKHKEAAMMLHAPLIVITGGTLVLSFISPFWLMTGSIILFGHFLHDCLEVGPGIKWLAPFSGNSYQFLRKGKLIHCLSETELKQQYAITMEMWLERVYLRPTPEAIIGILILLGATLCAWLW